MNARHSPMVGGALAMFTPEKDQKDEIQGPQTIVQLSLVKYFTL